MLSFMCKRMSFTVTFPSMPATKASWNLLCNNALSNAKQCVSAGCISQVMRAGTHTTQMFHLLHIAKNLGPR